MSTLGLEDPPGQEADDAERHTLTGVREAFTRRVGQRNQRMTLRISLDEIDAHPGARGDDGARAEAFNRFLADPQRRKHAQRWDATPTNVLGFAGLIVGAVAALLALGLWIRAKVMPPE